MTTNTLTELDFCTPLEPAPPAGGGGIVSPVKPRMRGWIHLWACAVAVVCGITLVSFSGGYAGARAAFATAVYSLTVCAMFGISATYHRIQWTAPKHRALMKRLDHSMIFLFIAGTYTPFCLLVLRPQTYHWVLSVVWGGALAGVVLKVCFPHSTRWLGVALYLMLGWVVVFVIPEMVDQAGITPLVLLAVGGALYSVGAVLYATKWPNPWPRTFGHHEFFHAATVVAAVCHHVAIWFVVVASAG